MSSPVQALQGQVPGVIITRSSGAPGDESWGMKLRGAVFTIFLHFHIDNSLRTHLH